MWSQHGVIQFTTFPYKRFASKFLTFTLYVTHLANNEEKVGTVYFFLSFLFRCFPPYFLLLWIFSLGNWNSHRHFFQMGQKKGERRVSWKFQETSRPFSKERNYYPNVRLLLLGFLYNYRKATGKKLAPNIRPLASSSGQGRTFNFGIIFFARKKCISSVSSDGGWGWRNMFQKVDSRKVEWNGGRAVGVTASMTVRIYSIWKWGWRLLFENETVFLSPVLLHISTFSSDVEICCRRIIFSFSTVCEDRNDFYLIYKCVAIGRLKS